MFNKSSKIKNDINNKILKSKIIKLFGNTKLTILTIFSLSSLLIIYLMLPCNTQIILSNILKHPLIISTLLILSLLISFINTSISISLIIFLIAIYFGNSNYNKQNCYNNENRRNSNKVNDKLDMAKVNIAKLEGFKNKDDVKNKFKQKEEDLQGKITSLFNEGPFSKSLKNYKKSQYELQNEDIASDNMSIYENKKRQNKKKEKFGNTSNKSREKFKSVPLRKFNPANKDDTNLLLVMEHCGDIKNRIEYEFEDITYLKKYIKDKLEKIIDLLDLVEDE